MKRAFFTGVAGGEEHGRTLEAEARLFGRYLVGRTPSQGLIERYAEAHRALFDEPVDERDARVVAFVHRHPWSVSFLDAGSGLLRPGGLLRSKILLMAAILEASPECAEEFLQRGVRPAALAGHLLVLGVTAVAKAVGGIVLYAAASRARA